MKKKRMILVVVLAAVFAFLSAVKMEVAAKLNPRAVEAELSKMLGVTAHTQSVAAGWNGDVDLLGVSLEEASKLFLLTPRARIHLRLFDLLRGKVSIDSLDLKTPELTLDDQVAGALSKLFHRKKGVSRQVPVTISHGSFKYLALNGKTINLNDIDGTLTLSAQNTPFHLTLRDPENGSYELSGSATSRDLNLQGKMTDVTLREIVSPFGISPLPELQGKVDGHFQASGPFTRLGIDAGFTSKSGLFTGDAVVNAKLVPTETGAVLQGKLYADHGQIEGIGEFKAFGVGFSTPSEGFVFQNGSIQFPSGVIRFSGAIRKNYAVFVKFGSSSFNPFVLPTFSGWGIRGSNGKIEGSASGHFPRLSVITRGRFPELRIGESRLTPAGFALKAHLNSDQARIESLKLSSPQSSFTLAGGLTWDNEHNLQMHFRGVDGRGLASLFHLGSNLYPMAVTLSGSTSYTKSDRSWKGNVEAPRGEIAGEFFDAFRGRFSYEPKAPFRGRRTGSAPVIFSGSFQMGRKTADVSGTWKDGQGDMQLDAAGFPLQHIPLLKGTALGFKGMATIHAQFTTRAGSESQISFSLPHATYKGKPIPAAEGSLIIRNDEVHFSPLRLTSLSPPLFMTGFYNMKTKRMQITANLNGQDSRSLVSFLSAKPLRMSGLLYGPLQISGTYPNLYLRFQGSAANAHFQGFTFDRGSLALEGTLPNHFSFTFAAKHFSLAGFALLHQFLPQLEGTGVLNVRSRGTAGADISFSFPQASWNGKPLGGLEGSLGYAPPVLFINKLHLPLTAPPLSFSGKANLAAKTLELRSTLTGQSISELAKLASKSTGSADGNLYGTLIASGYPPAIKLEFVGTGKNLRFSGMDLGEADLKLMGITSGNLDIKASGLQASRVAMLQKAFPGLSGELSLHAVSVGGALHFIHFQLKKGEWKGKFFPSFAGALTFEAPLAKFTQLDLGGVNPPLSASGEVNSETHAFHFGSNLAGQHAADLAGMLGVGAREFDGALYGPISLSGNSGSTRVRFSGTGKGLKFHAISLGSGRLDFSAESTEGNGFAIHLTARGIPAASVQLLAARYPGISGNVAFDVSADTANTSQATLGFRLSGASYHERSFPELEGKMSWNAPSLEFAPLSAPKLSPPLVLNGAYRSDNDAIHLSGQLEGQMISELMVLAGSTRSDVDGQMYGPVSLSGSSKSPELDFHGEVTGLAYKGLQLGRGRLDLFARSDALRGKLVLNNPVSLDPNDSLVSNLISRIPGIGDIYGNIATNVIMLGVTIEGTPAHPEFSPMLNRIAVRRNPQGESQNQPPQQNNPIFDILNQVLKPH